MEIIKVTSKDSNGDQNLYPDAGENAPQGVKDEIEAFRKLSPEERSEKPLLYHLLGDSTPPYKMRKEAVDYTDDVKTAKDAKDGERCGTCAYWYKRMATGQNICSIMSGEIKTEGWCNRWTPMEDATDEVGYWSERYS